MVDDELRRIKALEADLARELADEAQSWEDRLTAAKAGRQEAIASAEKEAAVESEKTLQESVNQAQMQVKALQTAYAAELKQLLEKKLARKQQALDYVLGELGV